MGGGGGWERDSRQQHPGGGTPTTAIAVHVALACASVLYRHVQRYHPRQQNQRRGPAILHLLTMLGFPVIRYLCPTPADPLPLPAASLLPAVPPPVPSPCHAPPGNPTKKVAPTPQPVAASSPAPATPGANTTTTPATDAAAAATAGAATTAAATDAAAAASQSKGGAAAAAPAAGGAAPTTCTPSPLGYRCVTDLPGGGRVHYSKGGAVPLNLCTRNSRNDMPGVALAQMLHFAIESPLPVSVEVVALGEERGDVVYLAGGVQQQEQAVTARLSSKVVMQVVWMVKRPQRPPSHPSTPAHQFVSSASSYPSDTLHPALGCCWHTQGYVGLGFTARPTKMFPSDVVIGTRDARDNPVLQSYRLQGYTLNQAADVNRGWTTNTGLVKNGATTLMCFSRPVNTVNARVTSNLDTSAVNMIWAMSSGTALVEHTQQGSLSLNMDTGVSSSKADRVGGAIWDIIHGALMLTAFVFLMPAAVLLARHKWLFGNPKVRPRDTWGAGGAGGGVGGSGSWGAGCCGPACFLVAPCPCTSQASHCWAHNRVCVVV